MTMSRRKFLIRLGGSIAAAMTSTPLLAGADDWVEEVIQVPDELVTRMMIMSDGDIVLLERHVKEQIIAKIIAETGDAFFYGDLNAGIEVRGLIDS